MSLSTTLRPVSVLSTTSSTSFEEPIMKSEKHSAENCGFWAVENASAAECFGGSARKMELSFLEDGASGRTIQKIKNEDGFGAVRRLDRSDIASHRPLVARPSTCHLDIGSRLLASIHGHARLALAGDLRHNLNLPR